MDIVNEILKIKRQIYFLLQRSTGGGGSVSDTAYGASWDGDTTVAPSKNAVYDKIQTIAGGTPGGSDTQVQFNDGGSSFGGDAGLVYNKTTDILTVGGGVIVTPETASRIAHFDASKQVKALDTTTYPSLTELAYGKGVTSAIQAQMDLKAALASPALTGTPTAPTAALLTNTTQIATTAFVQQETNGQNSYIANKISLQLFNSY